MGGVLSIWPFAMDDMRSQVGAGKEEPMYRGVRLGVLLGYIYHLYCCFYCIYYGLCYRGLNIFFLVVLVCQTIIFYELIPPLLLLTYLVKYAVRSFASAAVRARMLAVGMEVCQFIGGILWSFLLMHFFESYKDGSSCMRRHNCEMDSYFSTFETVVYQICPAGSACTDFCYNLPWVFFATIAHFVGSYVHNLWSDGLPPPSGDPPAKSEPADPNVPVVPSPAVPSVPAPPPVQKPSEDPPKNGSGDGEPPLCATHRIAAKIRQWIEEAIDEVLCANRKQKRRNKSRSKKSGSKSRKRNKKCDDDDD